MPAMTIYAADPSMLGPRFIERFEQVEAIEGVGDGQSSAGLRLQLSGGWITLNFMPPEDMPDHLDGLAGYCAQHLQSDPQQLGYVLSRVSQIRIVMGCVPEPGLGENEALDFVSAFQTGLNGLLLVFNSLYDFDGACLVGPAEG